MSGWVAQRECAQCFYSGPEVDFSATGLDDSGNVFIVHRDTAPDVSALICDGCAVGLMRMDALMARRTVLMILVRERFPDERPNDHDRPGMLSHDLPRGA